MSTEVGKTGAVPHGGDNATAQVRAALSEVLSELHRPTQDSFFDGVERALADASHTPIGSSFGMDSVRRLRQWSADYQRVAIELEATASRCRLAEREINQRIDALLGKPQATTKRRAGELSEQMARPSPTTSLYPAGAEDPDGQRSGWRWLSRRISRTSPRRLRKPPPRPEMAARALTDSVAVDTTEVQPVTVHLLGGLRVAFGDRSVETWASGRGRAIFEYLVVHRHSRVRRDRLMAVFWPESSADAARNNLNVAIHGLRQTLRTVAGDRPIVICKERCYFIEPDLGVWVDVEAFEERLKSAEQRLITDEAEQAQTDFEMAVSLYQGDFLADDPGEPWGIVTREHLRLRYLDALDQLARLRFSAGDYTGCAETCLRILSYDACREDAHRLLMRCHSRRGQPQLALRQYHSCAATLRQDLQLSPARSTLDLFYRIRRRESV
jgi:DNA-binding SARP family transcriptional activator